MLDQATNARQFTITRVFDAPRELVFAAHSIPMVMARQYQYEQQLRNAGYGSLTTQIEQAGPGRPHQLLELIQALKNPQTGRIKAREIHR